MKKPSGLSEAKQRQLIRINRLSGLLTVLARVVVAMTVPAIVMPESREGFFWAIIAAIIAADILSYWNPAEMMLRRVFTELEQGER